MLNEKALGDYLREEIFPQLSPPPYGEIEVRRLTSGKPVYLFIEKERQLMVVGKSFQYGHIPLDEAWISADREYGNLKLVRNRFGMNDGTSEIISPLGENKQFSAMLVTQKAPGHLLDHYIFRAIYEQRQAKLYQKLACLARFFARLHMNSRTDVTVSSFLPQWYLNRLLEILRRHFLSYCEVKAIEERASHWWNKKTICGQDQEVMVHGDANPTNFFLNQQQVIGIDLEGMKRADRSWDLGFLAAELKHHFLWRTGNKWASEPFIGHFLWEYAVDLGDARLFEMITRKLPLYMALGLIRMARNLWLSESYRRTLIEEAKLCLEYGQ